MRWLSAPRPKALIATMALGFAACTKDNTDRAPRAQNEAVPAASDGPSAPKAEVATAEQSAPAEGAVQPEPLEKDEPNVPEFQPAWTVRKGVEELYEAYVRHGLEIDDFLSSRFVRIKQVREMQDAGLLTDGLRRTEAGVV